MTESNHAPVGVPRWHAMVAGATATLLAWWLRPCALHDESLAVLGLPGQPAAIASSSLAQLYRWLVGWLAAPLGLHAAAQAVSAIAVGVATAVMHRVAAAAGVAPLMEVDHGWCHSLYYVDPNGIMVELCRDTPGFTPNPSEAHRLLTADARADSKV